MQAEVTSLWLVSLSRTVEKSHTKHEISAICCDLELSAMPETANEYELHDAYDLKRIRTFCIQSTGEAQNWTLPELVSLALMEKLFQRVEPFARTRRRPAARHRDWLHGSRVLEAAVYVNHLETRLLLGGHCV